MTVTEHVEGGLTGLSELLLAGEPHEEALRLVAALALRALPGADGASVCLLRDELPETRIGSHAFVRNVVEVQFALLEGPCLEAARTGAPVRSDRLEADARYPAFGPAARDLGVRSALAVPLLVRGACLGSLTGYAHAPDAFDADDVQAASAFAGPAAVVVANARALEGSRLLASQLREAMASRAPIEQAKGVLMARHGLSADAAFDHLRLLSQTGHRKLRDVAAEVLAGAAPGPGGRPREASGRPGAG